MTQLNLQYCFPTVIMQTVNEPLADVMLPIAKKYLADKDETVSHLRYKSTYKSNGGLEKYEDMQQFANYINELGSYFLTKQGYSKDSFSHGFRPHIFASEMFNGDFHDSHAHPNSVLSGVVYLQVPKDSAPIVFVDPRPYWKFFSRQIEFPTDSNMNKISVMPQKGMVLLWESWLDHEVPVTKNTEEGRITLVFNLMP